MWEGLSAPIASLYFTADARGTKSSPTVPLVRDMPVQSLKQGSEVEQIRRLDRVSGHERSLSHHRAEPSDDFLQSSGDLA